MNADASAGRDMADEAQEAANGTGAPLGGPRPVTAHPERVRPPGWNAGDTSASASVLTVHPDCELASGDRQKPSPHDRDTLLTQLTAVRQSRARAVAAWRRRKSGWGLIENTRVALGALVREREGAKAERDALAKRNRELGAELRLAGIVRSEAERRAERAEHALRRVKEKLMDLPVKHESRADFRVRDLVLDIGAVLDGRNVLGRPAEEGER